MPSPVLPVQTTRDVKSCCFPTGIASVLAKRINRYRKPERIVQETIDWTFHLSSTSKKAERALAITPRNLQSGAKTQVEGLLWVNSTMEIYGS